MQGCSKVWSISHAQAAIPSSVFLEYNGKTSRFFVFSPHRFLSQPPFFLLREIFDNIIDDPRPVPNQASILLIGRWQNYRSFLTLLGSVSAGTLVISIYGKSSCISYDASSAYVLYV